MKIWDKVKASLYGAYAATQLPTGTNSDFKAWNGRTFWGVDNSQLVSNETIFSIITRLSNTLSSLPFKLYQEYNVADNAISDLLMEPNQNMNGWDFLNKMEVSRNEHGNAYAVILRDVRLQPSTLLPVENETVTPFIDNDTNELWYEVRGRNETFYVHNLNMLHVKHITGVNRIVGISPLKVLRNALQYDKAVQEFSLSEMEKKESFKLTYGANVDADKQEQVIANFRRFYAENGGVLFQEPGVTIDEMRKNYTASDTASAEKITRTRVANVFNVPLSFLNEQGAGFSTNEQAMTQFVQMTLMPIIRQYEQEFNRKLLTKAQRLQKYYFKFSINGLLRADTNTRSAFYQQGIRNGWFTQNEVRGFEDLPPNPSDAANHLWISGDLYNIDTLPSERNGTAPTTNNSVEGETNN